MKALIISVLWLGTWSGGLLASDDSAQAAVWLERLQSGSAQERERAQRWLGLNLTVEDYPLLAEQARRSDAEAQRRLILALASEPEHLALALLLVDESDTVLQDIGDAAFRELVTRWCPQVVHKPTRNFIVQRTLADGYPQTFAFGGGEERIELHIDRLDRRAGIGVPLVVDPSIADRMLLAEDDEGPGLELLGNLCSGGGLLYSGIGDWSDEFPGRGAWILVSAKSGARSKSGAARLLGWFRSVQANAPEAPAAARSLAVCGWPAALHWLDQRWRDRRDGNALEGLVAAASRGRASRSMWTAELRSHLLSVADGALASSTSRLDALDQGSHTAAARLAERIARGLIGAGGMQLGGDVSNSALTEGWDQLNESQRWLRLVILEGQRTGGERVAAWLAEELAQDTALSPAVRFQALRTLVAMPMRPASPLRVAGWPELVAWSFRTQQDEALAHLVSALGFTASREGLPVGRHTQLFFLHLALLERNAEKAVRECLLLGNTPGRRARIGLIDHLERARFESGPALVQEVARQTLAQVQGDTAHYLADTFLFAGALVSVPAQGELPSVQDLDLQSYRRLGAWSGTAAGGRARVILLAAAQSPPATVAERQALVGALNLALQRLREAGEDRVADRFTLEIWAAVAEPRSALHDRLGTGTWPTTQPSLVIDMLGLDRELPDLD